MGSDPAPRGARPARAIDGQGKAAMVFRTYDDAALAFLKAYAFCVPLLYIRIGEVAVAFVDAAAPVALLLLALSAFRMSGVQLPLYLAFFGMTVLSLFTSTVANVGAGNFLLALRLLFMILPMWIALSLTRLDDDDLREVFRIVLIGAGVGVLAGIALHSLGITVREEQQRLWLGTGSGPVYRAGGVVGESGAYGQITAIFGTLLFTAASVGVRVPLALSLFGWAIIAYAFLISSSRGGLVMLAASLLVVSMFRTRSALVLLGLALFSFGVMAGLVVWSQGDFAVYVWRSLVRLDLFNLTGESEFGETIRFQTWNLLLDRFFDVPMLGYGYRTYSDIIGAFIDNSFLLTWFDVGPVGFVLFTLFWLALLVRLFDDTLRWGRPMSLVALALTVGFVVRMQTGGAHTSWTTAPVVYLLIGLALRLSEGLRTGRRLDRSLAAPPSPAE